VAREYTRVKLTIWNDPDFRCLTSDAQWLYFVLMTHPSISLCGVVDWREARLTAIAADMSVERLRAAAVALGRGRFIAVDPETEESLVRSFVRHDGVLKSPNMARAMVRQHAEIASLKIMELVSVEVRRATVENPEWKGLAAAEPVWKQYPESDGLGIDMVPETLLERVAETLPEGFVEPFQNGSDLVPLSHKPITLTSKDVSTHAQSQAIERDRPSRFERTRARPVRGKPSPSMSDWYEDTASYPSSRALAVSLPIPTSPKSSSSLIPQLGSTAKAG
jgi:hypothetical protein